jgi:hypothetical protein
MAVEYLPQASGPELKPQYHQKKTRREKWCSVLFLAFSVRPLWPKMELKIMFQKTAKHVLWTRMW